MAYAVRTVKCTTCGREMTGRYRPRPPWYCLEHAVEKMVENARRHMTPTTPEYQRSVEAGRATGEQIRRKSGPVYEKWREGMLNWVESGMARDDILR